MQISWGLTMKKDIHIYIYKSLFQLCFPRFSRSVAGKKSNSWVSKFNTCSPWTLFSDEMLIREILNGIVFCAKLC